MMLSVRSLRLWIDHQSAIYEARRRTTEMVATAGMPAEQDTIGLVVTEMAQNVLDHGIRGEFIASLLQMEDRWCLDLSASDYGDHGRVKTPGLGTGMVSIRKHAHMVRWMPDVNDGNLIYARLGHGELHPRWNVGCILLGRSGDRINGDTVVVKVEEDWVRAVVFDGLGHGPMAASSAERVRTELGKRWVSKRTASLKDDMEVLHSALRGLRGGAVCAVVAGHGLETISVGNVSLWYADADERVHSIPSTYGIVGHGRPDLRIHRAASNGQRPSFVMHSDGVQPQVMREAVRLLQQPAGLKAAYLHRAGRRANDDCAILCVDGI